MKLSRNLLSFGKEVKTGQKHQGEINCLGHFHMVTVSTAKPC